jgi:transposase
MAHRHELTAAEWARIAPLLPARETKGTYYEDHRRVLNGMLYRHATGCAWRDLPERYGPWSTVASRQRRWTREGLWDRTTGALGYWLGGRLSPKMHRRPAAAQPAIPASRELRPYSGVARSRASGIDATGGTTSRMP